MLTFHPMGISKQDFSCSKERMHIQLFRHRGRKNWTLTMEQRTSWKGWPKWLETMRCEFHVETLGEALAATAKALKCTIVLENQGGAEECQSSTET